MPAKYRVGVIGHTGRGDYGHGIDTVWLHVARSGNRRRCRRAMTKAVRRPPSDLARHRRLPTTASCSTIPSQTSSASARAGWTSIAKWSWPPPSEASTSIWKNRCAARSKRPTEWWRPATSTTSNWRSPTRRATARNIQVIRDLIADGKIGKIHRTPRSRQRGSARRRRGSVGARQPCDEPDAHDRRRTELVFRFGRARRPAGIQRARSRRQRRNRPARRRHGPRDVRYAGWGDSLLRFAP